MKSFMEFMCDSKRPMHFSIFFPLFFVLFHVFVLPKKCAFYYKQYRWGGKANALVMNSMKLVIPLHSLYWSIHTKDESKRATAFAFIFGVN